MTLDDMVTIVCENVKQRDPASREVCKLFVRRRYVDTVCNSYPWRDLEVTGLRELSSPDNVCDLPSDMDRVVAIRCDENTFLQPASVSQLMQTDPGILDRIGIPSVYREVFTVSESLPDDDSPFIAGKHNIEIYPRPQSDVSLFIAGKRTPNPLVEDDSEPDLRNIDSVLIAFATGDMLSRQGRVGQGQEKFKEAAALLTQVQQLEANQANQPRQIKQLTAAGNSLAELTDHVSAVTGHWGLDDQILIQAFLRRNYQALWDQCNWQEANVCAKVNTDGACIVLPHYFDRIFQVRLYADGGPLDPVEPSLVFGLSPLEFEETGYTWGYSLLTSVGVRFFPPTREKLSFHSTDSRDKGAIFVMGELRGGSVSETVTLRGRSTVQTVSDYDTPLTVSKGTTKGSVIVNAGSSGDELETLLPNETERRHMRIWLHPEPMEAQVALILGKRTITPFAADQDVPILRDCSRALIAAASADIFERYDDKPSAATQRKIAEAAIQTLVDLETKQGAMEYRVLPYVEEAYGV